MVEIKNLAYSTFSTCSSILNHSVVSNEKHGSQKTIITTQELIFAMYYVLQTDSPSKKDSNINDLRQFLFDLPKLKRNI